MHNQTELREFWYTLPENWNFKNPAKVTPTKLWFYKDDDPELMEHQWRLAYNNEFGYSNIVFPQENMFDTEDECAKCCNLINYTLGKVNNQ